METRKYKELCQRPWAAQMCEAIAHKRGLWWETALREMCAAGHPVYTILSNAFQWSDTPQGHEYWKDIRDNERDR